jgi:hypothetical protein
MAIKKLSELIKVLQTLPQNFPVLSGYDGHPNSLYVFVQDIKGEKTVVFSHTDLELNTHDPAHIVFSSVRGGKKPE